jgi:hypothetical protein
VTTPYVRSSSLTRRHDRHLKEVAMSSPTRESIRQTIADRLLDSLENLVRRHRALAMTHSALQRHQPLRPT